jgi:hypothetical protein
MSKMTKRTKLGLGASAVGVIVALAALVALVGAALAATGSASLDSPTADASGNASVTLTMSTGVGNWAFDVGYTAANFTGDPTCSTTLGACTVKPDGTPGIVRFAGFDATGNGVGGEVGKIAFTTSLTTGCSNLTLAIAAKAGSAFQDTTGTDFTSPTFTAGKVCAAATAAPTAAPTASASPTAKALPASGGPLGDSSSMSLGWLLGAAGLIVVAGGAWTLARARREEN